jgi:hypothetical protein
MPQMGQRTKRMPQLRRWSCGTAWHPLDANQTLPKSFRMDSHSGIAWTSRTSSHVSYLQTKLMLIDVIWCN